MTRHVAQALALSVALTLAAVAQQPSTQDKPLDVKSSVGDLHVGKDADARTAGLPTYPGARPKHEDNDDPLNFALLTESVGLKLAVAKYESDDSAAKVIAFYRDKMKKYGKVLECRAQEHDGDVEVHDSQDPSGSKELKCDENSGFVTELKAGTEADQHVVAIEPRENAKGSSFTIVYIYKRDKKGDL
jgi:hypothetical protein